MGNREDADDILQTIFLRLLRREFPPDLARNPEAYLYRAAINLSLDTLKTRGRQPQRTDDPDQVAAPPAFVGTRATKRFIDFCTRLSPTFLETRRRFWNNKPDRLFASRAWTRSPRC